MNLNKMSSAICFNLDQSEILSSGKELKDNKRLFIIFHESGKINDNIPQY